MEQKILKKGKIPLGKIDTYGIGRKIHPAELELEFELAQKDDNHIVLHGKVVFTASAHVYNHIKTDIIMGGQCLDELYKHFKHDKRFCKIYKVWKTYHLNDLHPECEHQRELGWTELAKEEVEMYSFGIKLEYYTKRKTLEQQILDNTINNNKEILLFDEDRQLLQADLSYESDNPEPSRIWYQFKTSKTVQRGWLDFSKSEKGILCRPCPTCGYKYGTSWKYLPIPQDVIDEIMSW